MKVAEGQWERGSLMGWRNVQIRRGMEASSIRRLEAVLYRRGVLACGAAFAAGLVDLDVAG
jgi:hypothetical protein